MNAISSYLRHLIVTGIVLLVAKYKLPMDGAEDAAHAIALAAIGTGTWLVAKYAPRGFLKLLGFSAVLCLGAVSLPSCTPGAPYPIGASFSYRDPATGATLGIDYPAGASLHSSK